ncbi:MAG: hypothetical protein OCD02_00155 [Spirochaetaceae bacterium]
MTADSTKHHWIIANNRMNHHWITTKTFAKIHVIWGSGSEAVTRGHGISVN